MTAPVLRWLQDPENKSEWRLDPTPGYAVFVRNAGRGRWFWTVFRYLGKPLEITDKARGEKGTYTESCRVARRAYEEMLRTHERPVMVPFCTSSFAAGTMCTQCTKPASHKVSETIFKDDPNQVRHEFSAYLCCACFCAVMNLRGDRACLSVREEQ